MIKSLTGRNGRSQRIDPIYTILRSILGGGMGERTNEWIRYILRSILQEEWVNGSSDLYYDLYYGEEWVNGSSDPIDTVHTVFAITTSNTQHPTSNTYSTQYRFIIYNTHSSTS